MSLPVLKTRRLVLRGYTRSDAPRIQALAGDREVASTTLNIPHPYEDGMAEAWIATHAAEWEQKVRMPLAITTKADGLVGGVGLNLKFDHAHAELGYWIGVPYWNRGYATEAAGAIVDHAFSVLGLHRVFAHHFARNPGSGRVMQKLGMRHEGTLRGHILKWDRFEDLELYAVLAAEWESRGVVQSR